MIRGVALRRGAITQRESIGWSRTSITDIDHLARSRWCYKRRKNSAERASVDGVLRKEANSLNAARCLFVGVSVAPMWTKSVFFCTRVWFSFPERAGFAPQSGTSTVTLQRCNKGLSIATLTNVLRPLLLWASIMSWRSCACARTNLVVDQLVLGWALLNKYVSDKNHVHTRALSPNKYRRTCSVTGRHPVRTMPRILFRNKHMRQPMISVCDH